MEEEAGVVSVTVAAQLIKVSRQRLDVLVKEGWIKRLGPGRYRLIDVVHGYIDFLRDERSRANKSAADSRVRDAKLIEQNLKNAERMGLVVPREDFEEFVDAVAAFFLTELGSLPSRHHQRDLQERRRLERDCHGVLERASKHFKQLAVGLPATRTIMGAIPGADAGSVGRAQS